MQSAKAAIRSAIERAGYWFTHRSVLPFGVDYLWDIQRMAAAHSFEIHRAFDVGAYTGNTAKDFLRAFPDADIYSFEPHPRAFSSLLKIKSERLHAYQLAVSNKEGAAQFFVHREPFEGETTERLSQNSGLDALTQFGRATTQKTKTITVQCQTVDQFCADKEIESVDLLKIDTEGHEDKVLDGARDTLARRSVSFVFAEFETILPIEGITGGALAPVAERLEPLGFRLIATYPVYMLHEPLYASFNALYFRSGHVKAS
jgi:FkbM family methyltransferase